MIATRVEVGKSVEFVASHVRADGDKLKIWAQVNPEGVHLIEASIARLQPEFESNSGFLHHCQLPIGQIYCVRSGQSGGKWYRIRILGWPPNNPTTVAVHFIDYGWSELVSVSNVRHCGEIAHFPPQALEFIIADVVPPGNSGVWPDEILRFFEHNLLFKRVVGVIVGVLDGQTVLRVFRSGERVPFTDILVKQGLAFSNRVLPPQSPNEMAHYRGETFHALPLDLMKEHLVYVAHIESPQKFFVQLGEKEQEVTIMMEAIHIYAQQGSLSPLTTILPGTPCLAQFSGDGSYYRGIVTHVSGVNCHVVYVDYGNSEIKHCTELKAIPSEFLSLPLQAYQCSLVGAKSTDGRDLHVQTEGKLLSCHVLAQEGTTYVVSLKHQGKAITEYLPPSTPSPPEALKSTSLTYRYIQLECKRYNVSISYCFSPLEFYVQLPENTSILDKVMSQLSVCERSTFGLLFSDCCPNLPVCTKFSEDELWYRGEIIALIGEKGNEQITIKFVDYGNSEVTSLTSLKPMIPDLCQVPVQAIRLCLDGFQDLKKETLETPRVVKKFEEFALEKTLVAQIKSSIPSENSYLVELYDISTNPPLNINKSLSDFITEISMKPVIIHPPSLSDVERICVTTFTSVSEFFGQLVKYPTEHLEKLQARLNQTYRSCPHKCPNPVQMGQFVCAQFSEDGLFYRAKVLATRKTEAEVYFVDFGNKEIVHLEKIFMLLPEFAALPQQGILCCLSGTHSNVDGNEIEAVLIDRILEVCLLHQIGDKWEVRLTEKHPENADALKILQPTNASGKFPGRTRGNNFANDNSDWNKSGPPQKRPDHFNWSNKPPERICNRTNDLVRSQPARASHLRSSDGESEGRLHSGEKFQRRIPKQPNGERPRKIIRHVSSGSSSHDESDWETSGSGKTGRRGQQIHHNQMRNRDVHSENSDAENRNKPSFRNEKLTEYKQQILPEHACREVTISYAISPSEFYCQITEYGSQLDKLMDDISQVYGSLQSPELEMKNPRIGMPCCAIYSEDGGWYRAKIIRIAGPRTEVDFVDYGNREVTTASKIRELKPEFLTLPAQAIRCCLHNVQPVNGDWPVEVIEKFKETSAEKTFVAQFVKMKSEGYYEVNLLETDKLTTSTLNREFVNLETTKTPEWVPLEISPSATFTETVIGNGDKEDVIVTWIKSPCEFYCQLASSQETFRTVMFNIQERYSVIPPTEGIIKNPVINMACVAQFSEDGVWYRAQITDVKGDEISVFYVDYGNTDILPSQSVRHIETQFVQLPVQAVKCQLRGVKPVSNDEWYTAKRGIIEKYFEDSIVCTFVANFDSVFLVDLEKEGKSVAEELAAVGLAVKDSKPCSVTSADSLLESEKPSIPKLMLDVKPGDSVEVLVSFAESPKLFWCQLQSNSEEVENLVVTLTNYYSQLGDTAQNVVNPSPGTPCAAKFSEDARWYRACVLDRPGPGRLKVLFIDYGNQEVIHHTQCKVLLPEYSQLPAQAIKCILPDLPNEIPDELAKDFVNMVDGEEFAGRVEEVRDDAVILSLFTTTEGQQVNVAHTIFGSILLNQHPKSPCFMLDSLPEQVVPMEEHAVIVCFVHSISQFFIRLVTALPEFQKMKSSLSASEGGENLLDVAEGCVCCVKHSGTQQWIRAHVISISDNEVRVADLDSGEELLTSKASLKQIPESLLQLPPFAYECKLDGVCPVNEFWSEENVDLFKSLVKKEPLIASFLTSTRPFSLCLQNEDGSISEHLIELGAARKYSSTLPPVSYKSRDIPHGEMLATVYVVMSVNQFYISPSVLGDALETLSSRMQDAYDGTETPSIDKLVPGMPCAAKYSVDGVWYRAIVLNIDDELVSVRFVDYGNTEVTKSDNLKALQEEFLQEPPFSVECCLNGIKAKENMEIEAQVHLENLVLEQEVTIKVLSKEQPYKVEIHIDNKDITEELLNTGAFVKLCPPPEPTYSNIIGVPNLCYRKCNFGVGQKKQVTVSFTSDPGEFWIQLIDGQICLEDLMQELQERYGAENEADVVSELVPGLPCVAQFADDGLWYRAEFVDAVGDAAKVHYVDYGNEGCVTLNSLKAIEPDLVVLPKQAIKCFLADVEPCDEEGWSLQAIEGFNEEVMEKILQVEAVAEVEGSFGVVLTDTGMNIAKKLIAKGIAMSKETSEDLVTTPTDVKDAQVSEVDSGLPSMHDAEGVTETSLNDETEKSDYKPECEDSTDLAKSEEGNLNIKSEISLNDDTEKSNYKTECADSTDLAKSEEVNLNIKSETSLNNNIEKSDFRPECVDSTNLAKPEEGNLDIKSETSLDDDIEKSNCKPDCTDSNDDLEKSDYKPDCADSTDLAKSEEGNLNVKSSDLEYAYDVNNIHDASAVEMLDAEDGFKEVACGGAEVEGVIYEEDEEGFDEEKPQELEVATKDEVLDGENINLESISEGSEIPAPGVNSSEQLTNIESSTDVLHFGSETQESTGPEIIKCDVACEEDANVKETSQTCQLMEEDRSEDNEIHFTSTDEQIQLSEEVPSTSINQEEVADKEEIKPSIESLDNIDTDAPIDVHLSYCSSKEISSGSSESGTKLDAEVIVEETLEIRPELEEHKNQDITHTDYSDDKSEALVLTQEVPAPICKGDGSDLLVTLSPFAKELPVNKVSETMEVAINDGIREETAVAEASETKQVFLDDKAPSKDLGLQAELPIQESSDASETSALVNEAFSNTPSKDTHENSTVVGDKIVTACSNDEKISGETQGIQSEVTESK